MISAFFINLGATIAAWFFSLLPSWNEPTWLTTFPDLINGIIAQAAGLGAWIPWTILLGVVAVNIVAWIGFFGVKLVLKAAAFLPFVGGSG